MKIFRLLLPIFVTCISGCGPTSPGLLPSSAPMLHDDLSFISLADGIKETRRYLERSPSKEMSFGTRIISQSLYSEQLGELERVIRTSSSLPDIARYIHSRFDFVRSSGEKGDGKILLTGYFEPIIKGSRTRTKRFSQPLYTRPPDLFNLNLSAFSETFVNAPLLKARTMEMEVVPYYSRRDIDGPNQCLAGKGLEIAWVDPIDAFFLHIQGSGTIELANGGELYVNYSDKNGHRYEAIGKYIKDRIAPASVTMQSLVQYLRSVSEQERDDIMFKNPSYVFFRESTQRAVTATGIPAMAQRSIATDSALFPKGALGILRFTPALTGSDQITRFVLNHDSGGAIKGPGRVDLFCGRGPEAQALAGPLQDKNAEIYLLVPKN